MVVVLGVISMLFLCGFEFSVGVCKVRLMWLIGVFGVNLGLMVLMILLSSFVVGLVE